jgi:hypothetical protein
MTFSNAILIAAIFSGVFHSYAGDLPTPPAYWTPTNLASRIAGADRVIATNWFRASRGYPGHSLSFSGSKATKIVQAVSTSRAFTGVETWSMFDWELQFYKGTNRLDAIHFQGGSFKTDSEYFDQTGVLDGIYQKLERRFLKE